MKCELVLRDSAAAQLYYSALYRVVQIRPLARLHKFAPVAAASSRNLADVFLDNPVHIRVDDLPEFVRPSSVARGKIGFFESASAAATMDK